MTIKIAMLLVSAALAGYAILGPELRVRFNYVKKAEPFVIWRGYADVSYVGMTVKDGRLQFINAVGQEITLEEFKAGAVKSMTRPAYLETDITLYR